MYLLIHILKISLVLNKQEKKIDQRIDDLSKNGRNFAQQQPDVNVRECRDLFLCGFSPSIAYTSCFVFGPPNMGLHN